MLKEAIDLIFSRERGAYECVMNDLTDVQARCLVAIARIGGEKVYSKQFQKESGVSTGTAQVAIKRLLAKGVIYETNNAYEFVNPFFRYWIRVNE
jgi:DNA-binding MarR family transcriptional regulator